MVKLKEFGIYTTDNDNSPEKILDHYRAKDVCEKLFEQVKVYMDGNRVRTHNDKTTGGKVFITFIACIIREFVYGKLSKYLNDNNMSFKIALNQLDKIIVLSENDKQLYLKETLTKK